MSVRGDEMVPCARCGRLRRLDSECGPCARDLLDSVKVTQVRPMSTDEIGDFVALGHVHTPRFRDGGGFFPEPVVVEYVTLTSAGLVTVLRVGPEGRRIEMGPYPMVER